MANQEAFTTIAGIEAYSSAQIAMMQKKIESPGRCRKCPSPSERCETYEDEKGYYERCQEALKIIYTREKTTFVIGARPPPPQSTQSTRNLGPLTAESGCSNNAIQSFVENRTYYLDETQWSNRCASSFAFHQEEVWTMSVYG